MNSAFTLWTLNSLLWMPANASWIPYETGNEGIAEIEELLDPKIIAKTQPK